MAEEINNGGGIYFYFARFILFSSGPLKIKTEKLIFHFPRISLLFSAANNNWPNIFAEEKQAQKQENKLGKNISQNHQSPGSYQGLDLFIKVLRVLCLNLPDASEDGL